MASRQELDTAEDIISTSAQNSTLPTRQGLNPSLTKVKSKSRREKRDKPRSTAFNDTQGDAALRQAAEGGYLISPSRAFLLDRCSTAECEKRSLKEIEYLHLSHTHIRTLGYIQSCRHLRVCILSNNYLTRFNALANCPELVRLDLHSNQIIRLPDESFWSQLEELQVLNLHDNGIGSLDAVQALSACPNLMALTMYDTPVSLKHNYRHHTVNSIWTLKALDHHVISDEEIIEDAQFHGRFQAHHPSLAINLCPKESVPHKDRTLALELQIVKGILETVNRILAHCSPVTVIQRWTRGHLARKKRGIKYTDVIKKLRKRSALSGHPTPGEGYDIDFDTYMENRRPGSKTPTGDRHPTAESFPEEVAANRSSMSLPTSLHINLAKLEKVAMKKLLQQSPDISDIVQVTRAEKRPDTKDMSTPLRKRRQEVPKMKRREPQTVQQMLGPKDSLVQPPSPVKTPYAGHHPTPTIEFGLRIEDMWVNGEQPQHAWRIHNREFKLGGEKPPVMELDPLQDHTLMVQESGRDVRETEEIWHDQRENQPKPSVTRHRPEPRFKDQVSLATLIAVSKAYKDRDRADLLATKMDRVLKIQQEKLQTRHIVNAFKEERRNLALNKRQEDRIKVTRALQQQEVSRAAYIEYAQDRKEKALQRHQIRHKDIMFAADFSNQQSSVSSALVRHDRQSNLDALKAEKKEMVKGIQLQLSEQADLVRRYMEHKQLMLQLANGQEKAELGTRALQEANDRVLQTKQRVAAMKARKAAMKALHQPPATADRPDGISRASLISDGLHAPSSMMADGGVMFPPPTPRKGGVPNVTPRHDQERTHLYSYPRPKTTTLVELPPVQQGLQSSSAAAPRQAPTLTLST